MKQISIPDPHAGQKGNSIKCPDCERTWPSKRHRSRYELHWRVVHAPDRA